MSMPKWKSFQLSLVASVLALASGATAAELPSGIGWQQLPNTKLRSVCAADHGFPQVGGTSGCAAITFAWNSSVFDTSRNRLIVWGGGHNDYYGNEMYAVNLATQTVERLNAPGLPTATSCQEAIANGTQPNSRHTYDGIEYIPGLDKMFVFGGSLACSSGNFGRDTWLFSFATMQWERKTPTGPLPRAIPGTLSAYDPVSGLMYVYDDLNFFSYDLTANKFTQLTTSQQPVGYHLNAVIDPVRRKFLMIGWDNLQGGGRVWSIDLNPGSNYQRQAITTTGGASLIGNIYPGVEYDPVTDRIVAWGEDSPNVVYSLNLDTREWTSTTFTGGPTPAGNGTFGRWRYSPASNVFVLANRVDDNVVIMRLGTGTAQRPNAPTALTVQ
jgi:hypothetical protein